MAAFLAMVAGAVASCSLFTEESLETAIERRMEAIHAPGLQAVAVRGDAVVWHGAFGVRDSETGEPMVEDSLLMIGSISKTMAATVALQLSEDGLLDLDVDVTTYLPFSVRNPHFPDVPLTARMLLGHRSGILDNWDLLYTTFPDHSPEELEGFLRDYLLPGGALYDPEKNWYAGARPGEVEIYSSMDMTLLAFLEERITGQGFAELFEQRLRAPLSMDSGGGWQPDRTDAGRLARGAEITGEPLAPRGFRMWPAGNYITNALSLSRFLCVFTNAGSVGGIRILQPVSISAMLPAETQAGSYGLSWSRGANSIGGRHLWGHGGKTFGYWAMAVFDPDQGTGAVVLTNGDIMSSYVFNEIIELLMKVAVES